MSDEGVTECGATPASAPEDLALAPGDIPEWIIPADAAESPIYVTRPELPPLQEVLPYLERVWATRILTNNGPFHCELESELESRWGVGNVSLFANGTVALVTALQALGVSGEVITTPFSFAATAHAIAWNGLTPVFADIEAESLNLDPDSVSALLSPRTGAILPVHCFGRAADVERLGSIADDHDLQLIYDAAHAFDVDYKGRSLLSYGDISVVSFHATKVFTTFEGGAIISSSAAAKRHIDNLKNFGILDQETIVEPGINGKMSEFSAALGLAQLKHVDEAIARRGRVADRYLGALRDVNGLALPPQPPDQTVNHGYFPVMVGPDYPLNRDQLFALLVKNGVMVRKYFYPLLSEIEPYRVARRPAQGLPNARRAADRVLCLPIYPQLSIDQQDFVISILANPLQPGYVRFRRHFALSDQPVEHPLPTTPQALP